MNTHALNTLVNPDNWELEEQYMDGASLGYSEAFYVGDTVYLDGKRELDNITSRIAALEAQNKKLVEALEKACKLEHFKEHTYGGFEFSKCPHHSCVAARALLSEVAQ